MPMFMLINDILYVCMLLACRLCFITTLFIKEGDQVKSMILGPILSIKVFLVTCMLFPFSSSMIKNHENTGYVLWFCKLASYWWLTATIVRWGKQSYCSIVVGFLKSGEKEPLVSSPRVRYKPLSHPCGGNYDCCITLCLESQRAIVKE
jgi:uncharacterized membrane protein